jgi:hypothetical protein
MSADATKSESSDAVTAGFLDSFADAWNRHDVDAILSMMSHDCVFEASRGPDAKGTIYAGSDARGSRFKAAPCSRFPYRKQRLP